MNKIDWNEAPEWADRFMLAPANTEYFCNAHAFIEVLDSENTGNFGLTTGVLLSDMELIEMRPEVPQVWMPEVGGEYEVMHYNELLQCKYVGLGIGNEHVFQITSGAKRGVLDRLIGTHGFRPLKTQQEKDREAFIELGMDIITSAKGYSDIVQLPNMLSILFNAKFAAPKAGE
tara:strand:+ start:691 stop:1212 length:522 start_codon:yes stop_codon:yes gene_type:complete